MEETPSPPQIWHVLTPPGVARFASASFLRVLLVQFLTAAFVAGCAIWFYSANIAPVIAQAIEQLPEDAKLSQGSLENVPVGVLADGKFLSISADDDGTAEVGTGDVQVVLSQNGWMIVSVLGALDLNYPLGDYSLARSELEPWWGAWQIAFYAGIAVFVIIQLFVTWTILAWLYSWLPKLLSFFADKELSWSGSRRLCRAAQLFGALLAGLCILLYGWTAFDLPHFLFFFAAHLVVDWIYVFSAPFFLTEIVGASLPSNPFTPAQKKEN